MTQLSAKERAILLTRQGLSSEAIAGILGVDLQTVSALMLQADPVVSLPPATVSIYVDWDTGSGPVASNGQYAIGTRTQNVYDALTGEPDTTLFDVEPYSGEQDLIDGYDKQVKLLTRGLYLVTTFVSMGTGVTESAKVGNRLEHVIVGDYPEVVWLGGGHHFHAYGQAMVSEQFLIGEPPASLYLQYFNATGLSQDIGALSSIISRISPL